MSKKRMEDKANSNGEKDMSDIMLQFSGERFIVPEGMNYEQARTFLTAREEEAETIVSIHEIVECFPLDGAVAFARVLKKRYGWTQLLAQKSMWGPIPPTIVGVNIGPNETTQVAWGTCSVPKIDGTLKTGFHIENGLPCFVIGGEVRRKHEHLVSEIAQQVRESVRAESIYRGKAIRVNMRDGDGDRISNFGPTFAPKFLDLDKLKIDEIVYSDTTGRMLQTNLFNLVENSARCRSNNIPLKRGVMLEGQFGTGKTLTADLLAKKCQDNGWTFIYMSDARDLDVAMGFANLYAPAVVFAEDIDRCTSGPRQEDMDKLFNVIDGIDNKHHEVMVVLTTNNINNIHPGFLRPGRMDTVVSITPPDKEAIRKLVRLYCRDDQQRDLTTANDEEIDEAFKLIRGVNAAFIREVVERSKLSALGHSDALIISGEDLKNAVISMKPHVNLLYPNLEHTNDIHIEGEEIDPITLAMNIITDRLAWEMLQKVVDPKVMSKVVMKAVQKSSCGHHGLN